MRRQHQLRHGDIVPHQWDIILQELPPRGYRWDMALPRDVMRDEHLGEVKAIDALCADVGWKGSLIRRGDCFHLTGRWRALIRRDCCRCLSPFDWQVEGDVERNFQLAEDRGNAGMDDVLVPPGQLDLVDLLREEIWLSWQGGVPCSEQCAGLCGGCGCNLNTESCNCRSVDDDHPFAALRQLKLKD